MGKEPSPFLSPLRVSHGMGLEVGQQRPRPLDCLFLPPGVCVHAQGATLVFSVEPCKALDWRTGGGSAGLWLGACPDLLLSLPTQGQDLGAEVWVCFQMCRYRQ